jgi:putative acetyltransferase
MLSVAPVAPADLEHIRTLFREYADAIEAVCGESLRHQGFEAELASLPGKYGHPEGGEILLARNGVVPAGCVALRAIPPREGELARVCEMKRLYVRTEHRGLGLGRLLAERVVGVARELGYGIMRLDTSAGMAPARHVYGALGFCECERYNDDPMGDTVWYELRLNRA